MAGMLGNKTRVDVMNNRRNHEGSGLLCLLQRRLDMVGVLRLVQSVKVTAHENEGMVQMRCENGGKEKERENNLRLAAEGPAACVVGRCAKQVKNVFGHSKTARWRDAFVVVVKEEPSK